MLDYVDRATLGAGPTSGWRVAKASIFRVRTSRFIVSPCIPSSRAALHKSPPMFSLRAQDSSGLLPALTVLYS